MVSLSRTSRRRSAGMISAFTAGELAQPLANKLGNASPSSLPSRSGRTSGPTVASQLSSGRTIWVPSGAQMRSKASSIISREVALTYAECAFEPRVFEHIPGIANGIADTLSRLHEPGTDKTLPEELRNITPSVVPLRTKDWYVVLATP